MSEKSGAQKSTGFLKDESRFPQTMEVAISVDRFDLIALAEGEADLRLFAGMQLLALIALLGLERYPLDVVLRQHGMLHGADLDICLLYTSPSPRDSTSSRMPSSA